MVEDASFLLLFCVQSGSGHDYIGQIVEFFEDVKHDLWFTAQWFFRVQDTVRIIRKKGQIET